MKSFLTSTCLVLGLIALSQPLRAQSTHYGTASYLPSTPAATYPAAPRQEITYHAQSARIPTGTFVRSQTAPGEILPPHGNVIPDPQPAVGTGSLPSGIATGDCASDSGCLSAGDGLTGWLKGSHLGCMLGDCCCWFGNVGGLYMTRDRANNVWLSYNTEDVSDNLLSSRHADMDWGGGFEVRLGRYFNCGRNAIETIYWGLYPGQEEANVFDPDGNLAPGGPTNPNLGSTLQFRTLTLNTGLGTNGVIDWFDDQVARHRLRRDNEFHNVEINLLGGSCFGGVGRYCRCCVGPNCCTGLRLNWYAGIRFFKFDEGFEFASSESDLTFDYSDDDVFYNVDVSNNLIGFQLGGRGDYCWNNCLSFYAGMKFGLYGNHINHHSRVGTATQAAFVVDAAPGSNDGRVFDIHSSKNDVAFLGEIDLGVRYQITHRLSVYTGWRTVAVTGVAMTTSQIPNDFADIDGVADIDSNGSLILTGGYAGLEYNF